MNPTNTLTGLGYASLGILSVPAQMFPSTVVPFGLNAESVNRLCIISSTQGELAPSTAVDGYMLALASPIDKYLGLTERFHPMHSLRTQLIKIATPEGIAERIIGLNLSPDLSVNIRAQFNEDACLAGFRVMLDGQMHLVERPPLEEVVSPLTGTRIGLRDDEYTAMQLQGNRRGGVWGGLVREFGIGAVVGDQIRLEKHMQDELRQHILARWRAEREELFRSDHGAVHEAFGDNLQALLKSEDDDENKHK